jgi:hypothetical protein
VVTKRVQQRSDSYASWPEATSCSLQGVRLRRLSKLYLLIRGEDGSTGLRLAGSLRSTQRPDPPCPSLPAVLARFEQQHARFATAADLDALRDLQRTLLPEAGVEASALPDEMLQAYAEDGDDLPAINVSRQRGCAGADGQS